MQAALLVGIFMNASFSCPFFLLLGLLTLSYTGDGKVLCALCRGNRVNVQVIPFAG
jgi:hypothetical protein